MEKYATGGIGAVKSMFNSPEFVADDLSYAYNIKRLLDDNCQQTAELLIINLIYKLKLLNHDQEKKSGSSRSETTNQ